MVTDVNGKIRKIAANYAELLPESMSHQVRNLAQPLVMVIPMLYAGMLLGGVPKKYWKVVPLAYFSSSTRRGSEMTPPS